MASSSQRTGPPRAVRRGNTSGLIGLWQSKAEEGIEPASILNSNSANVNPETLAIRNTANRRISVRTPPKLDPSSSNTLSLKPDSSRLRKSSEIVRPTFSIYEERSSEGGMFTDCVKGERVEEETRGFSFAATKEKNNSIKEVAAPSRPSTFAGRFDMYGRRDTEEELCIPKGLNEEVKRQQVQQQQVPKRGAGGLGRSKSVRCPTGANFMQRSSDKEQASDKQESVRTLAPAPKGRALGRSTTSAKETILAWVQATVNHYENVTVTNFSSSWKDGLAFCALIHNFYPEAFAFDQLDAHDRETNFTVAFQAAEVYGDITPLLDVEDMMLMATPDWKCVFTYVQCFYRRFRSGREKPPALRTLRLTNI